MRLRITIDLERRRPDPQPEEPQREVQLDALVETTDPRGSTQPPFGFTPRTTEPQ